MDVSVSLPLPSRPALSPAALHRVLDRLETLSQDVPLSMDVAPICDPVVFELQNLTERLYGVRLPASLLCQALAEASPTLPVSSKIVPPSSPWQIAIVRFSTDHFRRKFGPLWSEHLREMETLATHHTAQSFAHMACGAGLAALGAAFWSPILAWALGCAALWMVGVVGHHRVLHKGLLMMGPQPRSEMSHLFWGIFGSNFARRAGMSN